MSVLAIDPGFRTGWAWSDGRAGVLDLSGHDDHGQATAAFHDWLDEELARTRPVYIAIERAIFTGRFRHADFTLGLIQVAHMVAWSRDVPRTERTAQDVRKWLVGKARGATDREVIAAVNARGFRVRVSHEADAAALLCAVEQRAAA